MQAGREQAGPARRGSSNQELHEKTSLAVSAPSAPVKGYPSKWLLQGRRIQGEILYDHLQKPRWAPAQARRPEKSAIDSGTRARLWAACWEVHEKCCFAA